MIAEGERPGALKHVANVLPQVSKGERLDAIAFVQLNPVPVLSYRYPTPEELPIIAIEREYDLVAVAFAKDELQWRHHCSGPYCGHRPCGLGGTRWTLTSGVHGRPSE